MQSVATAMMTAAQLDLEPNTPQGLAYLIPYRCRSGYECQFQLGYKGLLQLAYRSGLIASINADVVYRAEVEAGLFSYRRGVCPTITHETDILRPELRSGEIVAAYAACTLRGGETLLRVIDAGDIARARESSASWKASQKYGSQNTPWLTSPDAMWMKTALRRLAAWMPQTEAIGMALEQDRLGDSTEVVDTQATGVDALNSALATPAIAPAPADDAQTINVTPQPEPQPAAMPEPAPAAPQIEQAAADKEAEKRRKEAELEALRAETEAFCLSAGMDTRAQEWAVGSKPRNRWTATDCKRLRKTAEERLAARSAAEQPQATPQEDAVRTVPCPRTGEQVAETVCNACDQRNGCPEWEA